MVKVTIFVEGGVSGLSNEAQTISANAFYREAFYTLFSGIINSTDTNILIELMGSKTQTSTILVRTKNSTNNSLILRDLDRPKPQKEDELKTKYTESDWVRIFFMIQEMEAWILSQPDKIEEYGLKNRLERKSPEIDIQNDLLIKNIHPEEIEKPSEKLDTILRRFFNEVRKGHHKGKRYHKTKDAPDLIALLDPNKLYQTFDEFQLFINKIKSYKP